MLVLYLRAFFGVALLTACSLGAGSWLSRVLPSTLNSLDRIAIALLGGFGTLSLVLFLAGQVFYSPKTILVVLSIVLLGSIKPLRAILNDLRNLLRACPVVPKVPLILIVVILVFTALAGLREVTGDWNDDAVAYHLLGPKVWLRTGLIRPVIDHSHTAMPQTVETMFGALLATGGPRAPEFFSFVAFGMLLLVAASLARRAGLDARGAWWLAAIVATMPAIYTGSIHCFVDGIYAAFVLAAFRVGVDAESKRSWVAFGIFCGLAMGTKYPGILAFPILLGCIAWVRTRFERIGWLELSKAVLVAGSVACFVAAPYYLRNWILLGCPIYPPPPGLSHFCVPKYLSPEMVASFHAYIRERGKGLGRGVVAFLLLPFNLTYHTSNFHGAGGIGLVPLALSPIGMIAARKNILIKSLAIFGFLLVAIWFLTQQESRFLISVYVISAIIGGVGWQHIDLRGKLPARLLTAAVVFVSVAYGFFMIAKDWPRDIRAVISPGYAASVRAAEIPYLQSFEYLNETPEVSRVLILDRSVPPFYSDKDYIKPIGQWGELAIPDATTPMAVLQKIPELHVSHVLDVQSTVSDFCIPPNYPGLLLVFERPGQRIYKIALDAKKESR